MKRTLVYVAVSLLTGIGIGYWAAQDFGAKSNSKLAVSSASAEELNNTKASGVLWFTSLKFDHPQLEAFDFKKAKDLQEERSAYRFGDYLPGREGVHYVRDVVYMPIANDAQVFDSRDDNTGGGFDDTTTPRRQIEELRNSSPPLYDSIPEVNQLLRKGGSSSGR
jgi:hypothetical protein